jgi:hypothetical protein
MFQTVPSVSQDAKIEKADGFPGLGRQRILLGRGFMVAVRECHGQGTGAGCQVGD